MICYEMQSRDVANENTAKHVYVSSSNTQASAPRRVIIDVIWLRELLIGQV